MDIRVRSGCLPGVPGSRRISVPVPPRHDHGHIAVPVHPRKAMLFRQYRQQGGVVR